MNSGRNAYRMASTGTDTDDCGKPNCNRDAEETYEGPNENTVRVCGMHYYKLVTRGESETSPLGLGTDRITRPSQVTVKGTGGGSGLEPVLERDTEPELTGP